MNLHHTLLAFASAAALAPATVRAQCFNPTGTSVVPLMFPTQTFTVDDEGRTTDILLPFAFPIGGAQWTHIAIESNGEIYFTNGGGVVNAAEFGIDDLAELRGGAGGSPRVMAFGGDQEGVAGLATWDIRLDDAVPGQVKVSWVGMRSYQGAEDYGMSVTLHAGGQIEFAWSAGNFGTPSDLRWVGLSGGDDAGSGFATSGDINLGLGTANSALLYQNVWAPFDLADQSVLFTPNGVGGYDRLVSCGVAPTPPAGNYEYGAGCYEAYNSFFQYFPDATAASAALQGNALLMTPNGTGYDAVWLPGAAGALYVPPTVAATLLAAGDDTDTPYTPSAGFPSPFGTVTTLSVHGNGIIGFGPGPIDTPGTNSYVPTSGGFLGGSTGGVYSWHDYNEVEGGDVFGEEIGGVTYVSYVDVEGYPFGTPTATPSTLQFQFDQATGAITIVWVAIDLDTSSVDGTAHLIGLTAPGASLDPGAVDLPAVGFASTELDQEAMRLSATPAPLSTAGSGTNVDFVVDSAPDVGGATPTGFAVGLIIWSVAQTSLPLAVLDPSAGPECSVYVASIDATASFVGPLGPQVVTFAVPAALPPGLTVFGQAVALSTGVNQFLGGVALSNGVATVVSDF